MFIPASLDDPALTLPEVLATTASNNPEHIYAHIVDGDTLQSVSWSNYLSQAKSVAAQLKDKITTAPSKDGPPAIAILANSDFTYALNTIAVILNGWIALPISIRMSADGISNLLLTSQACHLLTDTQESDLVKSLTFVGNTSALAQPDLLGADRWTPAVPSHADAPALYMHTSGTSGQPRLVPWTHRFCLASTRASYREYAMLSGEIVLYTMAPLYHAMGVFGQLTVPLSKGSSLVFHVLHAPLHMDTLMSCLRKFENVLLLSIPYVLAEIQAAGHEAMLELAKHTCQISYGGAPLDVTVGDQLVSYGARIMTTYGSTEVGLSSVQMPQEGGVSGEWQYFKIREGYGQQMLDLGRQDNASELLILAAEDAPALCNHPNGYLTGDIFYSHPTLPSYFKHAGRKTGVTILDNGEKVDNHQIQSILLKDERIAQAVVFGSGHFQIGVLLQPASTHPASDSFIDDIWPIIRRINKVVPRHARIVRPLVLTTHDGPGFSTTPKGSVKEWETLEAYAVKIQEAYATLESRGALVDFPEAWSDPVVTAYIRGVVAKALGSRIADDADFFNAGMDSLQVAIIRSGCNALLVHFGKEYTIVSPDVYSNPTIGSLAQRLLTLESASAPVSLEDVEASVQCIVDRYGGCSPRSPVQNAAMLGEVVLLTGSSGSLGVFLLHEILRNPNVKLVYCLNRSYTGTTAEARHEEAFRLKGLDPSELADPRIRFLYTDLSRADLSLDQNVYEEIQTTITRIIHCAWQLDFNLTLRSFEEPHISGVRHLADLAMKSPKEVCPRLVFISSIAACSQSGPGSITEDYVDIPPPAQGGYGQSKYTAEKLLIHLQRRGGLDVSIIRVGQLSGASTNGSWSTIEYMPAIFKTSHALDLFPSDLRSVRWLPVDVAAKAIAIQAFHDNGSLEYFNVDNSFTTEWTYITKMVSRLLQNSLRPVPMKIWLREAESKFGDCTATRLAPFLLDLAESRADAYLDLAKSTALCPELAHGPVSLNLLSSYLTSLGIPISDT